MSHWVQAGLWGVATGGALVLGAAVGYTVRLPSRIVAGVMAFGSGVLICTLCFELMEEAYQQAGYTPAALGFATVAILYCGANAFLASRGAKHRKRSNPPEAKGDDTEGGGTAIALGALLDGIPESLAIGLTLLSGTGVSVATTVAIFISNIPEGLSSSAGMKKSGRSAKFVFGLWIGLAFILGAAAILGYSVFGQFSVETQAATTALAAGAILAMISETMIPEAFEGTHGWSGLLTCAGFACAFALSTLGG